MVSFHTSGRESEYCTLMCYICRKYISCLIQKSTEDLCDITLKNDAKYEVELTCHLENDMGNLVNFNSTFESLKICTLMGSFEQSVLCLSQQITEELCVMTLKGDAIFKEKLTGDLKNDIRNLINFHESSSKSEY